MSFLTVNHYPGELKKDELARATWIIGLKSIKENKLNFDSFNPIPESIDNVDSTLAAISEHLKDFNQTDIFPN